MMSAASAPDSGGCFGTVKPCPHCMGGRNIQMGAGPSHDCETCEGSGLILIREARP